MTEDELQTMERYIKLWKSGSDVMAVWKKQPDRKSTRLNSSHVSESRMPSSA